METLLLNSTDVDENAQTGAIIDAVEDAFRAYERGDAQMPAKSYIDLPEYNGDFRSMPAYLDAGDWDAAGVKWVNVHTDNPEEFGLPTVMGTMVYSDPETARPLAIMDGTELTMKRTGAAAAVATDYLAVEGASSLGIVGAGVQAYAQLEAIAEVRDIEDVVVSDLRDERVDVFVDTFGDDFDVERGSVSDAASCDVLSTVTPVRDPIVSLDDVGDHTHVNAMGADAAGKHELTNRVLQEAALVIDDHEQCTHSGEINVPYQSGAISDADILCELGEIVAGNESEPTARDRLSAFDSTGLAIQDVAAARVVYEYAKANDNGYPFPLIDTDV